MALLLQSSVAIREYCNFRESGGNGEPILRSIRGSVVCACFFLGQVPDTRDFVFVERQHSSRLLVTAKLRVRPCAFLQRATMLELCVKLQQYLAVCRTHSRGLLLLCSTKQHDVPNFTARGHVTLGCEFGCSSQEDATYAINSSSSVNCKTRDAPYTAPTLKPWARFNVSAPCCGNLKCSVSRVARL